MNYRMISYILGNILRLEGILLLIPALIALYYGEQESLTAFLATTGITLVLGTLLAFRAPKDRRIYGREAVTVVTLAWVMISVFGAIPFYLSGAIEGMINCLFETISGFTTTGASILTDVEALPKSLLFWRSFTHWIGGMGILVFMLAIMPMSGNDRTMYLMQAEAPGPIVNKLVPKLKSTAKILYAIYIVLTLVLVLLLAVGGIPLFDSVVTAISTAGTGGLMTRSASIAAYGNVYAEYLLVVFMFLFSMNFNLFYLLLIKDFKNFFKSEELQWYLAIVVCSVVAITLNIMHTYPGLEEAFRRALFHVVSASSTTGFVVADYRQWPYFSQAILLLLIVLGGCGGSTSGGFKVSRFVILVKMGIREIKQMVHPRSVSVIRLDGMRVDDEAVRGVIGYTIVYLLIAMGSFLLISLDAGDFETSFTSILSCLSNQGPAFGRTGPSRSFDFYSGFSKIVLCFNMFVGRLEIFPIIMLFSPAIWRKSYM